MILIISKQTDEHANAVMQILKSQNVDVELLDLSFFPQAMALSMQYDGAANHFNLVLENGKNINLGDVRAVWWRRPQPYQLHQELTKEGHRTFAYNEIYETFAGLWHCLEAKWINYPPRDDIAQRKAYQLKLAASVGFAIPRTLISNNQMDAMRYVQEQGVGNTIYKAFSATLQDWRETRVLKPDELGLISNVKYAPVIFQEYIEATADIRITVIGKHIFPAAIYSQESSYKVDFRMDMNSVRVEAMQLPVEIEDKIRAFMDKLGLVYGAIDMRQTPDGRFVFLEINPAGQFLFIEHRTKQPIAETLAAELMAS